MPEPTDPKPRASAFESYARTMRIELDQYKRTIEHLKISMNDVALTLHELPDEDAVGELEQLLGEAGIFAKQLPVTIRRAQELAQNAPLGTSAQAAVQVAMIDEFLALSSEADALIAALSDATKKLHAVKNSRPTSS